MTLCCLSYPRWTFSLTVRCRFFAVAWLCYWELFAGMRSGVFDKVYSTRQ